jgi:hypothetical protein
MIAISPINLLLPDGRLSTSADDLADGLSGQMFMAEMSFALTGDTVSDVPPREGALQLVAMDVLDVEGLSKADYTLMPHSLDGDPDIAAASEFANGGTDLPLWRPDLPLAATDELDIADYPRDLSPGQHDVLPLDIDLVGDSEADFILADAAVESEPVADTTDVGVSGQTVISPADPETIHFGDPALQLNDQPGGEHLVVSQTGLAEEVVQEPTRFTRSTITETLSISREAGVDSLVLAADAGRAVTHDAGRDGVALDPDISNRGAADRPAPDVRVDLPVSVKPAAVAPASENIRTVTESIVHVESERRLPVSGQIQQFLDGLKTLTGQRYSELQGSITTDTRGASAIASQVMQVIHGVGQTSTLQVVEPQLPNQLLIQTQTQTQIHVPVANLQDGGGVRGVGGELLLPGDRSLKAMGDQAQWSEGINRRVALMVARGSQVARIQLDPPELGKLMIRIQVNGDQASVNFVSPHAVVRDALDGSGSRLQELLAEQGLSLKDMDVSDQTAGERDRNDHGPGTDGTAGADDGELGPEAPLVTYSAGLVDAYV